MNVKEFVNFYRPKVDKQLENEISQLNQPELVQRAVTGGKRLRPLVCILSYKLAGGQDDVRALRVAATTEFAHGASLLKDEILDKDMVRRGQPALWVEKGAVQTMQTADTMIMAGIKSLAGFGKDLLDTYLNGWNTSWQGESREFSISQGIEKIPTPMAHYYYTVLGEKTGSLFAASAKLGAQAANAKNDVCAAFWNWGYQLGILYQLADDYVDVQRGKREVFPFIAIMQFEEQMKTMFLEAVRKGKMSPLQALSQAGIDVQKFYDSKIEESKVRVQSLFTLLPVHKQLSAVAASIGDWLVEQQFLELETEKKKKAVVTPKETTKQTKYAGVEVDMNVTAETSEYGGGVHFPCSFCEAVFDTSGDLQTHVSEKHLKKEGK